jgi:hypothetical protein
MRPENKPTVSAHISQDHMATAFHFLISKRGAEEDDGSGLLNFDYFIIRYLVYLVSNEAKT